VTMMTMKPRYMIFQTAEFLPRSFLVYLDITIAVSGALFLGGFLGAILIFESSLCTRIQLTFQNPS
jgi:hypothetical protein